MKTEVKNQEVTPVLTSEYEMLLRVKQQFLALIEKTFKFKTSEDGGGRPFHEVYARQLRQHISSIEDMKDSFRDLSLLMQYYELKYEQEEQETLKNEFPPVEYGGKDI